MKDVDREWFEANPDWDHHLRPVFRDELNAVAVYVDCIRKVESPWAIARKLATGLRERVYLPLKRNFNLTTSNSALRRMFDSAVAAGRRVVRDAWTDVVAHKKTASIGDRTRKENRRTGEIESVRREDVRRPELRHNRSPSMAEVARSFVWRDDLTSRERVEAPTQKPKLSTAR